MFPKRIYLCGGSINTIAHLGALKELEGRGLLRFVNEWMGISAGALQALCLAAGYTLAELTAFSLSFDFQQITEPDDAPGWFLSLGFDTGNRLLKLLHAFLKEKGLKETTTFQQLYEITGNSFRTFASDMNTGILVTYSRATTPDYCVAHAVRASMSLPYYFQPFSCPISGHLLCDGGVITNYPITYLTEQEQQETLGLLLCYDVPQLDTIELTDMLTRPLAMLMQARVPYHHTEQTLMIPLVKSYGIDFGISRTTKEGLVERGILAAKEFLQARRRPVRRYSVG